METLKEATIVNRWVLLTLQFIFFGCALFFAIPYISSSPGTHKFGVMDVAIPTVLFLVSRLIAHKAERPSMWYAVAETVVFAFFVSIIVFKDIL